MHALRDEGPRVGARERALEEGVEALSDAELVAGLLGTGTAGRPVALVAAALLEQRGGIEGLARTPARALAEQAGVGLAKALRVVLGLELGRRAVAAAQRPRAPLRSSREVAAYFSARLGGIDHEEMWVVCLDGRSRMRACRRVARGGLHGCAVGARDILRAGLEGGASSIVLVHNHPSDDPTPSVEDVAMTRIVDAAAAAIGTPLVDHVVVTASGRHASMLDLGLLERA